MEKFKKCPFCGGEADYSVNSAVQSSTGEWHIIECINPNCLEVITHNNTKQDAIKNWNKRADGWISVEYRLPDPGNKSSLGVIVNVNAGGIHEDRFIKHHGIFRKFDGYVTHWQPLPQSPEQGER